MNKRKNFIKKNMISYNELMDLEDDNCVKVSGTYFHFLIAKCQLLNIKDKTYIDILYKYIEMERIYHQVKNISGTPSYILMSVSDIRYLVNYVLDGTSYKHVFIKSDIKSNELNRYIESIKKKYIEQDINKNKSLLLKNESIK